MKWFSVLTVEQGMTSLSETTMGDHKKTTQLCCRKKRWESGGCTCHAHPVGSLFQGESWPTSSMRRLANGFTLRSSEGSVKGGNGTALAPGREAILKQPSVRERLQAFGQSKILSVVNRTVDDRRHLAVQRFDEDGPKL